MGVLTRRAHVELGGHFLDVGDRCAPDSKHAVEGES